MPSFSLLFRISSPDNLISLYLGKSSSLLSTTLSCFVGWFGRCGVSPEEYSFLLIPKGSSGSKDTSRSSCQAVDVFNLFFEAGTLLAVFEVDPVGAVSDGGLFREGSKTVPLKGALIGPNILLDGILYNYVGLRCIISN
eukprot:m.139285 g.139285  ORF g.139285 m.139285 type:complete len:139 (-) comp14794_c0_seq2:67-483(-)